MLPFDYNSVSYGLQSGTTVEAIGLLCYYLDNTNKDRSFTYEKTAVLRNLTDYLQNIHAEVHSPAAYKKFFRDNFRDTVCLRKVRGKASCAALQAQFPYTQAAWERRYAASGKQSGEPVYHRTENFGDTDTPGRDFFVLEACGQSRREKGLS